MKNVIKYISILVLSTYPFQLSDAQLVAGEWRDHLSYLSAHRIAQVEDRVFCAAEAGMVSYNRISEELNKHSKVSGLSDVLISTIGYDAQSRKLFIGYTNGNIDLLNNDGTVSNIPDILRKTLTGSKSISNVHFHDGIAYLACGFGIVALDMAAGEIRETYFFGEGGTQLFVYDVTVHNNFIYGATETGIYKADLDSPNLVDFQYWNRITFIPQFETAYHQIETHNGTVMAAYTITGGSSDNIITIAETSYTDWPGNNNTEVYDICSSNNFLGISTKDRGQVYDPSENLIMDFTAYGIRNLFVDDQANVFYAARGSGFLWQTDNSTTKYLLVNGPRYNEVSKIATRGDRVWVSSGGPDRPYYHGAAHSLIDNKWASYDSREMPDKQVIGNTYKLAIHPGDYDHLYAGTYTYGLIEFRNNEAIAIYDKSNTPIFSNIDDDIGVRISGLDFDADHNLWMVCDYVQQSVFKYTSEGEWENPELSSSTLISGNIPFTDLLVTSLNQVWISTLTHGIVVLQDDGSGGIEERAFVVKNQDGTTLSRTYCISEDTEGNIWIGTNAGPIIYYSPGNIFNVSDVSGVQIKIPRNDGSGNADFLLGSDVILDIGVDGANRKWMGTDNSGVFLIAEDGRETLLNFRSENSFLLSNNVSGVQVNEISGEAFFATNLGLVSYKTSATKGHDAYTDVYVYPNPVRPEYEGLITITGLVENSIVKITDVSGNLVWETNSLGGQAIWDGKNFNGRRVASGIYLMLLAVPDGSQSHIVKLLFLN